MDQNITLPVSKKPRPADFMFQHYTPEDKTQSPSSEVAFQNMLDPALFLLTANTAPPASLDYAATVEEEDASFIESQKRAANEEDNSLVEAMASNSFTDEQLNNIEMMIEPGEDSTSTFPQNLNEFITMLVQLPSGRTTPKDRGDTPRDRDPKYKVVDILRTASGVYECPQRSCGYTTSDKFHFLEHLDANERSHTAITIPKIFFCQKPGCSMAFFSQKYPTYHTRDHDYEPQGCPKSYCPKHKARSLFPTLKKYNEHNRSHIEGFQPTPCFAPNCPASEKIYESEGTLKKRKG
jgi:hypothetical protein